MGDTANWEFAAVVAAVTIGLGGLLLFTIIGAIGSWRMYSAASRAATEAAKASIAMQDVARTLPLLDAAQSARPEAPAFAADLSDLREQAETLLEQQSRLNDAVRMLIEAGAAQDDEAAESDGRDVRAAIEHLDDNIGRITAAIASLERRK